MPKIDMEAYNDAEETSGGNFEQMKPGGYVLRIMDVQTEWETQSGTSTAAEKQCVRVIYDVAEGEFAGKFSDDYWKDKDYGHCYYLSWKNMGWLKKQLNAISDSNAAFDALSAFQADQWVLFKNKLFGAVLDGEVDLNDRGYDRWKLSVGDVVSVNDIHNGNYRDAKVTDNRGLSSGAGSSYTAGDPYGDIPL